MGGMWGHGKTGRVGWHLKASRTFWMAAAIIAGAALFTSLFLPPALAAQPAYSFQSPFSAEQCDRAIVAARQELTRDGSRSHGRLLLAEGLLCRGLEDDPTALDSAAEILRQIVRDEPANFFAQLELADALRKRFPLSDEAQTMLGRARQLLDGTDVGAARQRLAQYIDDNLAAMAEQHARTLPLVQTRAAALATGTLPPADMAGFVILLAQTGPDGVVQAERSLETYLTRHYDDMLATLYRAELLRAGGAAERARPLYADAEARLCHAGTVQSSECSLARWRLEQLDRKVSDGRETGAATGREEETPAKR